jgi:hypothetical protein
MMSKFNPDLNLQNGGTTVLGWGPLDWGSDPGAKRVVVSQLTITQDGVVARNDGGAECTRGTANWNLPLTTASGQRLRSGPAHARGRVTVVDPSGGAAQDWDDDVELH